VSSCWSRPLLFACPCLVSGAFPPVTLEAVAHRWVTACPPALGQRCQAAYRRTPAATLAGAGAAGARLARGSEGAKAPNAAEEYMASSQFKTQHLLAEHP